MIMNVAKFVHNEWKRALVNITSWKLGTPIIRIFICVIDNTEGFGELIIFVVSSCKVSDQQ